MIPSDAEQVVIEKAGDVPYFPELAPHGVRMSDLLPAGWPIGLTITPNAIN